MCTVENPYERNFSRLTKFRLLLLKNMIAKGRMPPILKIYHEPPKSNNHQPFIEFFAENIGSETRKLAFFISDEVATKIFSQYGVAGIRLEEKLFSTTFGMGVGLNSFIFFHLILNSWWSQILAHSGSENFVGKVSVLNY